VRFRICLYDLKRDPRYLIDKPFHSLFFYLPRTALDDIAKQTGAPPIGEPGYQPGIGHDDAVVGHRGASFREALRRPEETNQLFIDHMNTFQLKIYSSFLMSCRKMVWRGRLLAGRADTP
jgi:hypothetical protein